ncbi:MAG TPA: hypothetical protein VMB51_09230 [Solirubrobacteraceae bacterium]|nr:hypothetical protein [Solirubrobacteraceae bacterium]
MRPGKFPANGPADRREAAAAFGRPRESHRRRTAASPRLPALLACLIGAAIVLLGTRGSWFGLGAGDTAAGAESAVVCQGRRAPDLARISARELPRMRQEISGVMPARVGREYEAGAVTAANLWSDDEPARSVWARVSSRPVPAGYELRWWALDREGSEDDIVVDSLKFATQAEAKDALRLALLRGCRGRSAVRATAFPAGASNLSWVNPDHVAEWDALFVRGERLYRVADVPPDYPGGPAAIARRRAAAELTVDVLACALPGANCPASTASLRSTSLASLAHGSAIGPGGGRSPTRAQAAAYARAVNLAPYDLPESVTLAPEGPTQDKGYWEAFVRCSGQLTSAHSLVAMHSPVYSYRGYGHYERVYSTVTVLPSESAADRYMAALGSARAQSCITRIYERWLTAKVSQDGPLELGPLTMTKRPTPLPASYRGSWRYRAIALRLAVQLHYARVPREGSLLPVDQTVGAATGAQLALYIEGFAFAYGRTVVELTTFTTFHPFSQASERFLESALVGRAEANAGESP